MNKGIAVPYIIALILGIVVVALLGYWFFVLGGQFGGRASLTECQGKLNLYCNMYATQGSLTQDFTDDCPGAGTYAPECCLYVDSFKSGTWLQTCQGILG